MHASPSPAPPDQPRGNPNLALAPRCGARTRAGCPCQAPAIRGKQRCRMHGGRSTGPRTAEGLARLRAAHTTHGRYSADKRAHDRLVLTRVRRMRVLIDAIRHRARLPADLRSRLDSPAPELGPPPWPTGGLSRAEDRALMHAEAEALAPWKTAIAAARLARRSDANARRQPGTPLPAQQSPPQPHAPDAPPASRQAAATPHAPGSPQTAARRPAGPWPPGARHRPRANRCHDPMHQRRRPQRVRPRQYPMHQTPLWPQAGAAIEAMAKRQPTANTAESRQQPGTDAARRATPPQTKTRIGAASRAGS